MRTIGRRWPSSAPRGDYQCMCDYCGVHWRRSKLRKDQSGRLYCPDEGDGKDIVALERHRGEVASRMYPKLPPVDGRADTDTDPATVHIVEGEDISS